jgi:MFS family permease
VETWAIGAATSAYTVSLFWLGLLAGRLLVSFGYRAHRQEPLLLGLSLLALAALVAALLAAVPWLAGGMFLLSGLGFSAVYPVVMVLVGQHFREEQSLAIGVVSTGGGIGSLAFPFAMAAIAQRFSMRQAFWAAALVALLMAAAALGVWRAARRRT